MSINQAPVLTTGDASGIVKLDFGSYNADAPHAVVQADGKIVVNGHVSAPDVLDSRSELVRYNADGSLDTTFGTDGIVSAALIATRAADVAIQADGKIVVTYADYTVTRYNSDASLDTSFGDGGTAATVLDYGASSVLIQADGKIVVSGSDFALARYDSNGNLDPSFGVGGKVNTGFGGQGSGLVGQPDGKLIVAGDIFAGGHTSFAVARYNTDGSLDASFGTGGEVSTSFGSTNNGANSVTLQADGKIVAAGASDNSENLALVRYNVDGSLDASFGSGGMVTTSVPNGSGSAAESVKIQPDGKILVAGYSFVLGSNTDFVLVRYNSDGSLDSSFGTGGKVETELGSIADAANSLVLLPDGKILVVGTTGDRPVGSAGDQPGLDFALARYNSDGSLDTSFGAATALNGPAFFIEGTLPSVLNARATVHDAELDAANSYAGASLTLARHGGANAEDVFGASGNLAALTQGGDLMLSGVAIGTVTQNAGGTLVLTFGAAATEARVNEAMRDITYANSSENPTGAARIDWSFSDGNAGAQGSGGALAATGFTTVNLSPVNDQPVHTVPGPLSTLADVDLAITGLSVSDPDSASLTTFVSVSHGTLTATGVSGSGSHGLSLEGSVAQINAALSNVVYHSASDFSGADKLTITTFDEAGLPGATVSDDVTLNVTTVPGSVSINDVTISEGDSGAKVATFTVTRSDGTAAIDVNFATSDGSATTADNDYVATSGTLHFAAGVKSQTISVTIDGDSTIESDEAFSVNLSGATNGAAISHGSATGTITNDDAVPAGSVSINDVTISEGDSGSKLATFTVTRSGGTAAIDVNFDTSDGSATTADNDYAANAGTLHFGAGVNTQTISVAINGDTKVESDEAFSVNLSDATNGATISDGSGTGTITNDDVAPAGSVTIDDVTISEGDSGSKVATFTVTRSSGTAAFDVNFATSDAEATTADNDYVANAGTLHFGDRVNTQTISVTINGDTKVESDEVFFVNLSDATNGAAVNHSLGSGTITNDDTIPVFPDLTASNAVLDHATISYTINNIGTGAAAGSTTGIYLSTDSTITTSDTLIATHATPALAGGGSDFETASLSFPADLAPGTYFVGAIADHNGQIAETGEANNASNIVSITVNAAPLAGSVSINDAIISEGNSGLAIETFTVTRSGGTSAFDVNFTTSDNSATVADADYVAKAGALHFDANVDTQTISIMVNGDTKLEPSESFFVNLSGATNGAVISGNLGTGTIINDDTRHAPVNDFNGDGLSDVLWRNNSSGDTGYTDFHAGNAWHGLGASSTAYSVVGTGDFNGDGFSDALWRNNSSGDTGYTDFHGGNAWHGLGASSTAYSVVGTGDFNGDGFSDLLFRSAASGDTGYSDQHNANTWHGLGAASTAYSVVGTGDFNGDGFSDVLWRNNSSGDTGYSDLHNGNAWHGLGAASTAYSVVGTGDFNGDGFSDVLWRNNSSGDTGYTDVHGGNAWHGLGASSTAYSVVAVGDYSGDGFDDILYRNGASGDTGYSDLHANAWHGLGAASTDYLVVA
jgi:uncharacterized delta-60 repeat protein